MMLDEIDKMGRGIQGDPSAAMLEVLDPEQNATFRDNYLGVPFDLSRVVFLATANMLDTIPGPLRDRMEIISLAGYTEDEKLQIARRYLVRRQLEANGLTAEQAEFDEDALRPIIRRLHARSRRARARTRDGHAYCAMQRFASQKGCTEHVAHHGGRSCSDARAAALRKRSRDAHERARRCDRARVDAGRRRHPVHRGFACARQGRSDPDGPTRRGHARKRAGRADAS